MESKLFVGNLPYSTTEKDLHLLFTRAGNVASVNLIQDRQTGQPKVFAFVTMSSQADAQTAVSMFNGSSIADHKLIVKPVKAREAHSGYSSRLNAFAPADRRANARKPNDTGSGYPSRLSAFSGGSRLGGPRRRGGGKRD